LTGFLGPYIAVFNAVKAALQTKSSIKTVILGEQFSLGDLPKAVINVMGAPITQETLGSIKRVKANFEVILVIREYEPKDWLIDILPVMCDVVDAILANQTLGGLVLDCAPTGLFPGEVSDIKFPDKVLFGGKVTGYAEYLYYY
jgi:hypothetical protein